MSKYATLTFTIEIDEELEYDDDSAKELLLEIMASESDKVLSSLIKVEDSE